MSTFIKPGFRGYAQIDTGDLSMYKIRFNSCNINASQQIEAPDMVMGDETHNAWAFGKIEVAGSISGPVTESTGEFIDYIDSNYENGVTINVKYFDGFTRAYEGCRLNNFTFNVKAGDIVQYSVDIIGTKLSNSDPAGMTGFTKSEKLVTWDKASFRILGGISPELKQDDDSDWDSIYDSLDFMDGLESFTFTASNNISRQFILGQSDLFGDLVEGLKNVEGSITSYAGALQSSRDPGRGADFWNQYDGDKAYPIRFDIGSNFKIYSSVRFARGTSDSSTGPVVTTVQFKGITTHGKGNIETY